MKNKTPKLKTKDVDGSFVTGPSQDHLVGCHKVTIFTGKGNIRKVFASELWQMAELTVWSKKTLVPFPAPVIFVAIGLTGWCSNLSLERGKFGIKILTVQSQVFVLPAPEGGQSGQRLELRDHRHLAWQRRQQAPRRRSRDWARPRRQHLWLAPPKDQPDNDYFSNNFNADQAPPRFALGRGLLVMEVGLGSTYFSLVILVWNMQSFILGSTAVKVDWQNMVSDHSSSTGFLFLNFNI